MAHALLSPSAAHRWLACTPSARLEEQFPESVSVAASEGSLAHRVAEAALLMQAGQMSPQDYQETLSHCRQESLWQDEMLDHALQYAMAVLTRLETARETCPDAQLYTEVKLDLTAWMPEAYGTSDAVIIADGVMDVVDYKYGKGVVVAAQDNAQMRIYALGCLSQFAYLYDIREVRMSIYQPRVCNFPTESVTVAALMTWASTVLQPAAAKAFAGEGEAVPGEHCRFCRAAGQCRALMARATESAVTDAALLSPSELAEAVSQTSVVEIWLKRVQERALQLAMQEPGALPGYKVVEGRSVRTYSSQDAVIAALREAGVEEGLYIDRSLMTLTSLEKSIGKELFAKVVSPLVVKPQGKPTLAPASDKREAYDPNGSARQDFAGLV